MTQICNRCGHPVESHELDQMTLEPTKCPVYRQDDRMSPRGDY